MAKNWWEESTLESAAPKNESADEWKMLRHLGVHAGQGPWFAEPERLVMPI